MAFSAAKRSKPGQSWTARTPFFYGWIVVAVGAFSMFATSPGQSDSFAMFMDSFVQDFGWSRTYVSSLYAAATLLSGCLMFFVGRIVDSAGAKTVAIVAAAILGAACLLLSFMFSPLVLFGGFFLARFSGKGALELSASTLAPMWFIKRRALTIMLVTLGGAAGGFAFPLLNNYLISAFGWRSAFQFLAGGLWLIYIPIAFFFLIGRPEDVGLSPDNAKSSVDDDAVAAEDSDEPAFTQTQALRTVAFWIIAFCVFQASMVGTGVILHFISILDGFGYDMAFAAQIMSIRPLVAFVTVVVAGLVLDRIVRQNLVLALACLVQVGGYVLLAFVSNRQMAFAFAVISGFSGALLILSLNVLKPNLFGRRYLGGILGVLVAVNVIGSAVGPIVFGAAFDLLGGYREVILLCATLPLMAGILSVFLRKPAMPEPINV